MHVLYFKLKRFIYWPSRDVLHATMPLCFQLAFGKSITVIIDCFEVFIESPANLLSSAQTYSNYKHHKTFKGLMAITPQGTVSFISDTYGGRTSDKYITENSGFLDLIGPDDVVMADRGFLVEDSINCRGVKLNRPAFKKGK